MGMRLNEDIEKILFSRAKEGEENSFEILFNHYYSKLCLYAVMYVKFDDVAEEIVQETFINIWEKRSEISINTSFKSYLYRSVHNNCINYLNNKKYLNKKNESIRIEIAKQSDLNKNLDSEIINKLVSDEFNNELSRALESLPQQCRDIFMCCRYERLSYSEVANKHGISINTVKTQMKRALVKLKQCLDTHLIK